MIYYHSIDTTKCFRVLLLYIYIYRYYINGIHCVIIICTSFGQFSWCDSRESSPLLCGSAALKLFRGFWCFLPQLQSKRNVPIIVHININNNNYNTHLNVKKTLQDCSHNILIFTRTRRSLQVFRKPHWFVRAALAIII